MSRYHKERKEARRIASQYHNIKGKFVHHIDGNPENNSLGNLVVLTRKDHYQIHRIMGGGRGHHSKRPRRTIKQLESLLYLYNTGLTNS